MQSHYCYNLAVEELGETFSDYDLTVYTCMCYMGKTVSLQMKWLKLLLL